MSDQNPSVGKLDRRFIIERNGKPFALFAGLVDLAHQEGLDVCETTLLQIADDENEQTWIFKALVHTQRGTFTGHADANPSNVSRQMLTSTCRLAETRAIARALRTATNVGMTAFEELGDTVAGDDDERDRPFEGVNPTARRNPPAPATQSAPTTKAAEPRPAQPTATAPRSAPAESRGQPGSGEPATSAQVCAIYAIGRDQHNLTEGEVDEKSTSLYGLPPVGLTRRQASEFITSLKGSR